MYRRMLLAYDGSIEGRTALREGALLAKRCRSEVHLLSVIGAPGVLLADSAFAGALGENENQLKSVFEEAVRRLRSMGLKTGGQLVAGDPVTQICKVAREIRADLVVVGHRRQNLMERWWSGGTKAYLTDQLTCSLLISRNPVSDADFFAALEAEPVA